MARANRVSCARERPPLRHAQGVARPEPPHHQRARVVGRLDRQPSVGRRRQDRLALEGRAREELLQRVLEERVVEGSDGQGRRQVRRHGRAGIIVSDAPRDAPRFLRRPRRAPSATSSSTTTASAAGPTPTPTSSAAARAFAARLAAAGLAKGDTVLFWSREPPRVDRGALGLPAPGRRGRPDRLPRVRGLPPPGRAIVARAGPAHRRRGPVRAPTAAMGLAVWPLAEIRLAVRRRVPTRRRVPRRRGGDHLHLGRDRRAEGRGHHATATCSPTSSRSSARSLKYRKYARPFSPIRFLNLLPLSHMFGQSMATFIPPILGGTVVFMHGFNPNDIVRQVKTRRISVVVSVPKILDVLREHVLRLVPGGGRAAAGQGALRRRWWRYRRVHRLFGLKFWSFVVGAAPLDPALEEFWGAPRLRGRPGLRPHRDRADRQPQSPVRHEQGIGRQGDRAASR